jgi:hypothetical protein
MALSGLSVDFRVFVRTELHPNGRICANPVRMNQSPTIGSPEYRNRRSALPVCVAQKEGYPSIIRYHTLRELVPVQFVES